MVFLLWCLLALSGLKALAQIYGAISIGLRSHVLMTADGPNPDAFAWAAAYKASRPVDEALRRLRGHGGPAPRGPWAATRRAVGAGMIVLFHAVTVVAMSSVFLMFASQLLATQHRAAETALGAAVAANAVIAVLTALERVLIFGGEDRHFPDAAVPVGRRNSGWVVSDEKMRATVYFLVVAGLLLLAFAALYCALGTYRGNFSVDDGTVVSPVLWSRYSLAASTTLSIADDVHAKSTATQTAYLIQVLTGPLLVAWLLSTFRATNEAST